MPVQHLRHITEAWNAQHVLEKPQPAPKRLIPGLQRFTQVPYTLRRPITSTWPTSPVPQYMHHPPYALKPYGPTKQFFIVLWHSCLKMGLKSGPDVSKMDPTNGLSASTVVLSSQNWPCPLANAPDVLKKMTPPSPSGPNMSKTGPPPQEQTPCHLKNDAIISKVDPLHFQSSLMISHSILA
ncbi:hypothetical protein BDN67DRAFT_1053390 [Paxillus ammoniavirescens]|nr:hypothetical protein BDN67DRAFT_1053390 [Paxillus ammoniavirescens]